MAGGQERILRRRIKTVESTKKITRAMELIAATRVVKAQDRAAAASPYSEQITGVVGDLVQAGAARDHPLLQEHAEARTRAVICVTSDRGLCGAYNSTMTRTTERQIEAIRREGLDLALYVVGKKAQSHFRFRQVPADAAFLGVTDRPTYEHARAVADAIVPRYEAGELASADVVYWQFLSAGVQRPVIRRLLPVEVSSSSAAGSDGPNPDLEYEPSPEGILSELLPRYVTSRVFSALLDASASEHAARQRAMKSATDNAEDLKTTLTRVMNRARQDAITTEIMEIVGGAEALAQDERNDGELIPDSLAVHDLFRDRLDYLDHAHSTH